MAAAGGTLPLGEPVPAAGGSPLRLHHARNAVKAIIALLRVASRDVDSPSTATTKVSKGGFPVFFDAEKRDE
jgi:hypothetical protein